MKRALTVILLLLSACTGAAVLSACQSDGAKEAVQRWHCPMHPQYVSDHPGDCPICGMRLVPIETEQEPTNKEPAEASPGASASAPSSSVPGYAKVELSPSEQEMIGVQKIAARKAPLEKSIRTVGRVTYDETRLHHVHTKFEGFIEDLFVDYVGQRVNVGDPLFSVYSPDVVASQNEFLLALKAKSSGSVLPGINLVDSARRRLELWDVPESEISEIERSGRIKKAIVIRSPVSGFVTAKTALHGMKISPMDNIYDIADLSHVWVLADAYEVDLPFIKVGDTASVSLQYAPGRSWTAKVSFIYPTLEEQTRTAKVRLDLGNQDGALKPGMFCTVELKAVLGEGVVVPEDAILSTGERKIVFVAAAQNAFEPREVTVGVRLRGLVEIKQGLSVGEEVAAGANFLLDSESKLRAAVSAQTKEISPAEGHQSAPAAEPQPHQHGQ